MKVGSKYNEFTLDGGKAREKLHYDLVGIKSCVMEDAHTRTNEKIEKAKKTLNMSTNIRIKRGI